MCTPVLNFREVKLLNLNLCACSLELLLDGLSLFLRSLLLESLGSAVYESLSFLQAETCDSADFLDDSNLVAAGTLKNNVKLGLLSSSGSAAVSGSSNSYSSSCAYAKLILYSVYELGKLENGEAL